MTGSSTHPRVLIITPEVTYLPEGMDHRFNCLNARVGGLADVSSGVINYMTDYIEDVGNPRRLLYKL